MTLTDKIVRLLKKSPTALRIAEICSALPEYRPVSVEQMIRAATREGVLERCAIEHGYVAFRIAAPPPPSPFIVTPPHLWGRPGTPPA